MPVRWYTIVVDCHDVSSQARWWADVLDYQVVYEAEDEVVVVPPRALEQAPPRTDRGPGFVFVPVPEGKQVKDRLHIDLAPWEGEDHGAEVARLEAMGATRVDVGQGDLPWVVLADPEGNEFCVLTPRD